MKLHLLPAMLVLIVITSGSLLNAQQAGLNISGTEHEIDSIFCVMIKAAESLDANKLASGVDDRHHTGFISNNIYYSDFKNLVETFKYNSQGIESQQINIDKKKITVLPENVVILTATGKSSVKTIDGSTFNAPFFWSFVFEKIEGEWKVIHSHQSVKQ